MRGRRIFERVVSAFAHFSGRRRAGREGGGGATNLARNSAKWVGNRVGCGNSRFTRETRERRTDEARACRLINRNSRYGSETRESATLLRADAPALSSVFIRRSLAQLRNIKRTAHTNCSISLHLSIVHATWRRNISLRA